jgi:hypothetical protein
MFSHQIPMAFHSLSQGRPVQFLCFPYFHKTFYSLLLYGYYLFRL